MKALIKSVQEMSLRTKHAGNCVEFLDEVAKDVNAQRLIEKMRSLSSSDLGIEGPNDKYHFRAPLNRVTIDGNDDYRLVLFFIRKGT